MKTGWLTRSLCIITLLIMLQVPAFPQFVPAIKVTRLDTDESWTRRLITPGEIGHEFTIFTHQVVGIQFIANFKSDPSAIINWKAEFVKWWEYYYKKWPECVEFWEEKSTVMAPGHDAQLTNVVFVRPLEAGDYKFKVTAKLRNAEKPSDPDYQKQLVTHYTIIVHVENLNEARYPIPQIVNLDTSSFNTNRNLKYYSEGQSNQIQWQPVQENNPDLG